MAGMRDIALPNDPVSIGVLIVTAMMPLSMEGILGALGNIGAPSWRPLDDVVACAVHRLHHKGLLETVSEYRGDRFGLSTVARAALPKLLDALPLSAASSDIGYKLRVMGLDLLDPALRTNHVEALVGHWRSVADLWQTAEERCPCTQPSVRGWMKHNLALARAEIDWLTSVRSASPETRRR